VISGMRGMPSGGHRAAGLFPAQLTHDIAAKKWGVAAGVRSSVCAGFAMVAGQTGGGLDWQVLRSCTRIG
jgi:hypothetical protein